MTLKIVINESFMGDPSLIGQTGFVTGTYQNGPNPIQVILHEDVERVSQKEVLRMDDLFLTRVFEPHELTNLDTGHLVYLETNEVTDSYGEVIFTYQTPA